MRRYEKYKDSGIEWVGEIPEHWESIRLKYIGYLYGGLAGKSANDFNQESNFNNKPFIPFTNICNNKVIDPNQLQQVVIEEKEQQNQVAKGDLFFMMSSENFDDVGKSSILLDDLGETYLNSFCKGFRFTKDKYYPPFINYQLLSKAYRSLVLTEANGYTRINLKIDKINDIPLKTPPTLDEQIEIANYLDQKTAEIDELIKQKQELLLLFEEEKISIINHAVTKGICENVKLRDSKIEWIGNIPEHWKIKKLKLIGDIYGRIGYRGYTTSDLVIEGQGAITLSPSNMKDYFMDFEKCSFISWEKYEESPEIKIFDGDILFVKTGSTYGKVSIVKDLPEKATINPQIIVIKNIKCNNSFLFYFLKSNLLKFQVDTTVVGGTIPTISQDKISNYYLLIPPIEEQNSIVKHIEDEFFRIDYKIYNTNILIEQLKEYKTALITEVSTGKVKVI